MMEAVYASTQAAKDSGDVWCDGAEITITGGPTLTYFSALAARDDVGLIHKEPWGSGNGIISAADLRGGAPAGQDPDDWTDLVDISPGVKGTDYELSVVDGRAQVENLFNGGLYGQARIRVIYSTPVPNGFLILDDLDSVSSGGTSDAVSQAQILHYVSGDPDGARCGLEIRRTSYSTNWWSFDGASTTDTGVSRLTPARVYMYKKVGRFTLWIEDAATPLRNSTDPATNAGAGNGLLDYMMGTGTVTGGLATTQLGSWVSGNMEF
jgi:hypothetical protein